MQHVSATATHWPPTSHGYSHSLATCLAWLQPPTDHPPAVATATHCLPTCHSYSHSVTTCHSYSQMLPTCHDYSHSLTTCHGHVMTTDTLPLGLVTATVLYNIFSLPPGVINVFNILSKSSANMVTHRVVQTRTLGIFVKLTMMTCPM